MQLTLLHGYPDFVGLRCTWCGYGNGPTSLLSTGDPIALPRYNYYIDAIGGDFISVSGTYGVVGKPSAVGPRASWVLFWRFATAGSIASAVQNAAGSGMTPGVYTVNGVGGAGSGAQIQVTVLTATTIATPVVTVPGNGYTSGSLPTFTVPTGSTPTFTLTLSTIAAVVGTGANLSAEQVQIMGFGGQY